MDTSTIEFILKIFNYVCPIISLLLGMVITQGFFLLNEKKRKEWEKQKNHRDFQIEIKKARKEQTEEYVRKYSIAFCEMLGDILGLQMISNQEELDNYYLKVKSDNSEVNPDPELLSFTYYSTVRAFGDEKLNSLLDQVIDLSSEVSEVWKEFFHVKPEITYVLSRMVMIQDKGFDFRDKYRNLLVEFFQRLDKLYGESDPFIDS